MPQAPILNLGARWRASDVYWASAPINGKLLGVKLKALRGPHTNFAHQSGVYVLYADRTSEQELVFSFEAAPPERRSRRAMGSF